MLRSAFRAGLAAKASRDEVQYAEEYKKKASFWSKCPCPKKTRNGEKSHEKTGMIDMIKHKIYGWKLRLSRTTFPYSYTFPRGFSCDSLWPCARHKKKEFEPVKLGPSTVPQQNWFCFGIVKSLLAQKMANYLMIPGIGLLARWPKKIYCIYIYI